MMGRGSRAGIKEEKENGGCGGALGLVAQRRKEERMGRGFQG